MKNLPHNIISFFKSVQALHFLRFFCFGILKLHIFIAKTKNDFLNLRYRFYHVLLGILEEVLGPSFNI